MSFNPKEKIKCCFCKRKFPRAALRKHEDNCEEDTFSQEEIEIQKHDHLNRQLVLRREKRKCQQTNLKMSGLLR